MAHRSEQDGRCRKDARGKRNGNRRRPDFFGRNVEAAFQRSAERSAYTRQYWCSNHWREHGGFAHDDTNVLLLLSNPNFEPRTITSSVETIQVEPTILKALGYDPWSL